MTEPTRKELMRWCAKRDPETPSDLLLETLGYDEWTAHWQCRKRKPERDEHGGAYPYLLPKYDKDRNAAVRVVVAVCKDPDVRHMFKHSFVRHMFNHYLRQVLVEDGVEELSSYVFATATAEQLIRAAYRATGGKQ